MNKETTPPATAGEIKKEETEEERQHRLEEYRECRVKEQAALGKKLRKLVDVPR